MSRAYDHFIYQLENPEDVCRGNYRRHEELKPAILVDINREIQFRLKQTEQWQHEQEEREDEFLKQHGVC